MLSKNLLPRKRYSAPMWQAQKREREGKKTKGTRERDYQLEHGRAGLFATYIGKLVGSKFVRIAKNNSGLVNFVQESWLSFPQTSLFLLKLTALNA